MNHICAGCHKNKVGGGEGGRALLAQQVLEESLQGVVVAPAVARLGLHVVNVEPLRIGKQRSKKNEAKEEDVDWAEDPRPTIHAHR